MSRLTSSLAMPSSRRNSAASSCITFMVGRRASSLAMPSSRPSSITKSGITKVCRFTSSRAMPSSRHSSNAANCDGPVTSRRTSSLAIPRSTPNSDTTNCNKACCCASPWVAMPNSRKSSDSAVCVALPLQLSQSQLRHLELPPVPVGRPVHVAAGLHHACRQPAVAADPAGHAAFLAQPLQRAAPIMLGA